MDATQAARHLEVIRSVMERTSRYRLLAPWAALAAGAFAGIGAALQGAWALTDAGAFAAIWGAVFVAALLASLAGTLLRAHRRQQSAWSRPGKEVLRALAGPLFAACVLSAWFFQRGDYLLLPGVWMLCYGLGALAAAAHAPRPVAALGAAMLPCGALTLYLGPTGAGPMMALAFGGGHVVLAAALWIVERGGGPP